MSRAWLAPALDYIPRWLEHQVRHTEQPGAVLAIVQRDRILLERAFGHANLGRAIPLTPRHRFRVASHSKSFTAAGIMKLREQGRVGLDDRIQRFLPGLHREIGEVTVTQLLSHASGITRDGTDCGQWDDRRPFLSREELLADLAAPPVIPPNSRFKYSNHGYGLAGLVIEAITGEPCTSWIQREIVDAAGLEETTADAPLPRGVPAASGHSGRLPLGQRLLIPGSNPTHALAAATGFVSTAADLARFYGQLSPDARRSILSVASRREMIRRQWKAPHSSLERHYGLGIISGCTHDWEWFGHTGGFQGFITRAIHLPDAGLSVSILTNSVDGLAGPWVDGVIQILRTFSRHGAPTRRAASWSGRWWNLWGPVDFVPVGKRVFTISPSLAAPFTDATEMEPVGRDHGRILLAGGFASHGEEIRRVRNARGSVTEIRHSGSRLLSERRLAGEMKRRYRAR